MSLKSKQLDFTGQNIFVGIDVHKKHFTVSIQGDHLAYKTFNQPSASKPLVNYLVRNFPNANYYAVYEAGFSGFWLHKELESSGVNCIVVNPCDVPTTDKEKKQKRDNIDSRKLARSLKNEELTAIHVPEIGIQQDRGLLRTRKQLVGNQTRCRNRIKSLLDFYGTKLPEKFLQSGTHWSKRFMVWLDSVDLKQESGNDSLKLLLQEAESSRLLLLKAQGLIRKLSLSEGYKENMKLLLSVPGVGTLTGMLLLTEIGDINRFRGIDHLCSYIGLMPNVYASGEKEKVGDITKRGNKHLRSYIIESSWVAVRNDPALGQKYHELCGRMAGNKAIIRIARKLLNRIRYVLVHKQEYVLGVAA
jgi:transposase